MSSSEQIPDASGNLHNLAQVLRHAAAADPDNSRLFLTTAMALETRVLTEAVRNARDELSQG